MSLGLPGGFVVSWTSLVLSHCRRHYSWLLALLSLVGPGLVIPPLLLAACVPVLLVGPQSSSLVVVVHLLLVPGYTTQKVSQGKQKENDEKMKKLTYSLGAMPQAPSMLVVSSIRKNTFGLRIFPGFLTVLRVPGSSQGFSKYLKGTQGTSETHTVLIIYQIV